MKTEKMLYDKIYCAPKINSKGTKIWRIKIFLRIIFPIVRINISVNDIFNLIN